MASDADRALRGIARCGAMLAALAALLLPADAAALLGDSDEAFGLNGNIRSTAAVIDNYDSAALFGGDSTDAVSQTLLRLTVAGRPRPAFAYEVHGLQSFDYSSVDTVTGSLPFGLAPRDTRYRALDATWDWHEASDTLASLWLDRANVTYRTPWADVTLGRQAITFGQAFFWNPLDVFLPFDPRQFDQEYKPGVDAARIDIELGAFSGINVIASAGRTLDAGGRFGDRNDDALDASWFGSAVLGRVFTMRHGWDLALQGGKVYGGYEIGGGASGEVGPVAVRLEAVRLFADDSPPLLPGAVVPAFAVGEDLVEDSTSVVVGLGHRFENSLNLEFEYFFNGAGDSDNLDASLLRSASGELLELGEHLGGAMVSYDILPILTGLLASIVSFDDGSFQIQPRLIWSAGDEIEVHAGAIINSGERPEGTGPFAPELQSEFGTFPDVYYIEPKFYF